MKNSIYKYLLLFVVGLFSFLGLEAQYIFTTSASSSVSSVNTGSQITYTFNYSTAANTTSGQNVVAELNLPDNLIPFNESNFNSNVLFAPTQISSVTYNSGLNKVTITYVHPLPAGVTGQLELKLKYINGTTPDGYAPDLFTKVTFTNAEGGSPVYSDTLNIIAMASSRFTVSKIKNSGGAINDLTIFKISIGNSSPNAGALQLENPVLRDTLPTGVTFVEATSFSGSNAPTYDPLTRIITWTWSSGLFNTNYSGNAYVAVKYEEPTYQIGWSACNSATLSGDYPILPLGTSDYTQKTGSICFGVESPTPDLVCTGGGITAATASWLNKHVISGTSNNQFANGWSNLGNTELDSVILTYQIDKSVDVTTVKIGKLVDGLARTGRDTVDLFYKTNLNSSWTFQGNHIITADKNVSFTSILGVGEYLTEVKFKIYSQLPIGGSQSLTYNGNVRTSATNAKDGSPITEGTTYNTSNPGDDGTTISNNSQGSYYYGGIGTNFSNCSGTSEILISRPVFNSPSKSILNGSSFRASDTINYRFSVQLGGNMSAQNVVLYDTLDGRLTYIAGSSSIVISGNTIVPTVNGQILIWNLGTVPANGASYTVDFKAAIAPGTAPGSINNKMYMSADAPAIFPRGTNDNESTSVITAVALIAYKAQNGCDPGFVYYPTNAITKEGDILRYKVTVKNQGNVAAKDLTLIDVFPFIGDTRNSQWFANLVGPVILNDPNSTVYYNAVANPCYADFSPAVNPPGCSNPVWTLTPPINITSVTAIKIVRPSNLPALDSIEFEWPMRVPVGTPANIQMNNTIYYQVSRADMAGTTGRLLPAAPNQVGMITSCAPILGSIGDYVWIDQNGNGLQDEAANKGLNGVKVYLYGTGPDNQIGGGDDVLLDSTFTGNNFSGNPGYYKFVDLTDGKYFVKFETKYDTYRLTPISSQNPQTAGNNDADSSGNSGVVTINVAAGGIDKDNPTIDAGYYPINTPVCSVTNNVSCFGNANGNVSVSVSGILPYTYQWNTGPTTTSLTNLPIGTYTVVVNYGYGITRSCSATVTQPAVLASTLTDSNNISCRGGQDGSINISVSGGNVPYGYTWKRNGIDIVNTSQDLTNIFPGEYMVTILDNKGCSTSRTVVLTQPLDSVSTVITSTNVSCHGLLDGTISQTVSGGTTPYDFSWTKSGDLLFGSSNEDLNTLAAGTYFLEIEDNNGCLLLDTVSITQPTVLSATLDTAINQACSAVPSGSIEIDVVGGTTPYTYNWTNSSAPSYLQTTQDIYSLYGSNYRGVVTDNNGCRDTVLVTIGSQVVEAEFDADPLNCDGTYELTNNSIGADNYTWLIEGVAPTGFNRRVYCTTTDTLIIMDFSPGEYRITLTVSSNEGCVDSLTKNIIVMPQPIALFAYDPIPCTSGIKFTNLSVNGAITTWNFGDLASGLNNTSTNNNPTHTFSSNGTYSVTLIAGDAAGCKDTIVRAIPVQSVGITPTAGFSHSIQTSACATRVLFNNTSLNANSYLWIFDDGSTSNLANPSKAYPVAGTYPVQLISFSATGCSDTIEHSIIIGSNSYGAIAKFVANDSVQCLTNNRFNFINQSLYYGPGWVSNYQWNFGDGTTNNTNTFVYNKQYDTAGSYQVRLIAISPNGCRDTAYQMVRVLPEADPTFIMTIGCGMVAALEHAVDTNVSYVWSFGDGNFASNHLDSFSHTFTTPGKYNIRLTTYTQNGCSTTYSIGTLASDGRLPEPDFFYYVACANNIQFKNTSEWGSSYIWDFGDGSPADSSYEPYHSYAAAGTYNVTLTVYNSPQCLKSITYAVVAPQGLGVRLPRARLAYWVEPCTNITHARDSASKDATNFNWYLNNVWVANGANVAIPDPGVGIYQLRMIADNGVCADTTYGGFELQEKPEAGFDFLSNTCSNTIMVSSNSKHATSYEWNFDDAGTLTNTSYGASASHTFSANGTYNVRLIAYNLTGCADTLVQTITVNNGNSLNKANFTYINGLCNCKCQNTVKFNNLTPGSGNTYFWTFGDGTSSVQANPRKGFPAAGNYIVTLTSVDNTGCMSTKSMNVNIDASVNGPSAAFSTDFQVQCVDSNSYNFYNHSAYLGAGWINKYYWYFGDGTMDSTNSFIYNKKYTTAGNYVVTLVAVGVEGCRDTMSMFIQVRPLPCTGVLKLVNLQDGTNWHIDPDMGGILSSLKEVNTEPNFSLYPNPNTGSFKINVSGLNAKIYDLEIRDIAGRLVFEQREMLNNGSEKSISASNLSDGAYLVRILTDEGLVTERKFIVVK